MKVPRGSLVCLRTTVVAHLEREKRAQSDVTRGIELDVPGSPELEPTARLVARADKQLKGGIRSDRLLPRRPPSVTSARAAARASRFAGDRVSRHDNCCSHGFQQLFRAISIGWRTRQPFPLGGRRRPGGRHSGAALRSDPRVSPGPPLIPANSAAPLARQSAQKTAVTMGCRRGSWRPSSASGRTRQQAPHSTPSGSAMTVPCLTGKSS
jgi:hypothetical protein